MMNLIRDNSIFTVPLTLAAHREAERFRQQQLNPQQAKKVYLNALAVQAASFYLNCLGIGTELGDTWKPIIQTLTDTADLLLQDGRKLECRPMSIGEQSCRVPADTWHDRIGYLAIQFDPLLTEATLLGFVPVVTSEVLSLKELRSLAELPAYLSQESEPQLTQTHLSYWFRNQVNTSWRSLETLFSQRQAAFSVRGNQVIGAQHLRQQWQGCSRGKILTLASQSLATTVMLVVGFVPTLDLELDIWVRLLPTRGRIYLPVALELSVLDEGGVAVMQAQTKTTEAIQLQFSGKPGEQFSIKVEWEQSSITEVFLI